MKEMKRFLISVMAFTMAATTLAPLSVKAEVIVAEDYDEDTNSYPDDEEYFGEDDSVITVSTPSTTVSKVDLNDCTIVYDKSIQLVWTGYKTAEAEGSFKISYNGKKLEDGKDFDEIVDIYEKHKAYVSEGTIVSRYAGEYTLTFVGKGDYTGTVNLPVTVKPIKLTEKMLKLNAKYWKYDKKNVKPLVAIVDPKDSELDKALTPMSGTKQDYTESLSISYEKNCKKKGTHKVTVKGKGNYTGTVTLSYQIMKDPYTELFPAKKKLTKKQYEDRVIKFASCYLSYPGCTGKTEHGISRGYGCDTFADYFSYRVFNGSKTCKKIKDLSKVQDGDTVVRDDHTYVVIKVVNGQYVVTMSGSARSTTVKVGSFDWKGFLDQGNNAYLDRCSTFKK